MAITKLEQLIEVAKKKDKKRLVVAYGQDKNTLDAVSEAAGHGFVDITIVGDENVIKTVCLENSIDINQFSIINESDELTAGKKAVALVNEGKADFIMKGLISTDKYLKCILNKENGLMPKGKKSVTQINQEATLVIESTLRLPQKLKKDRKKQGKQK